MVVKESDQADSTQDGLGRMISRLRNERACSGFDQAIWGIKQLEVAE